MNTINSILDIITTKVPTCLSSHKVKDVREKVLADMPEIESVNYIYVISKGNKLIGVISIRELFSCSEDKRVRDIMTKKVTKAHTDTDPEKVAHRARQKNIKSIPIVDRKNNFFGIIPSHKILHILDSEAKEDLMRISGIIPNKDIMEEERMPIFKSFLYRTPWILIGLFGGIVAAKIISGFENVLEREMILAAFIPLVAYIANAVGVQTQTIYIRDIAITKKIPIIMYSIKQMIISLLIGAACWLTIAMISYFLWESQFIGFIVGFAVFCAILVATIFSILIPYILMKLKKDPAIGSGPFTTIIQDMLSIVIYFYIASVLLL
ncbi:MAG: magnesium transporter [Candidatus Woesearchaeota archaeon]